ncbi:hypothetical protein FJZ27_01195 [Candidatus Peribacteria bacterium]|nr:hypothetical protein [Candidatus Peribacteria bacterium]
MSKSSSSLESFIAHARQKGMDHQTIRMLLLSAGWKERDIAAATAEQGLDMPVPIPADAGGARDAFYHLLTFAGLYAVVISFLILAYAYINRWLPDVALEPYATEEGFRMSIRWSLSAIIVAYPVFVWISRILLSELKAHPEKVSGGVRRWLTYLTLFVAASVLMGDVIALIFSLLNGEITLRFFLKALVVFVVTGSVFLYYFQSLRIDPGALSALNKKYGSVTTVAVLASFIYGLVLVGSPGTERLRKIDAQRVNDIRTIAEATLDVVHGTDRWSRPVSSGPIKSLPKSLEDIAQGSERQRVPLSDGTGAPYVYSVVDRTHFSVCAVFSFENREQYAPFWDHPAGKHCYTFDAAVMNLP